MTDSIQSLLRATARSFYLTLRVLPAQVRPQIALAYLLARTADTIADTEIVPPAQRHAALQQFREAIVGGTPARLALGDLARQQGLPAEKLLLERVEESVAALQGFSGPDQELIREVLSAITSGQDLDLRRFGGWGRDDGKPRKDGDQARERQKAAQEGGPPDSDARARPHGLVALQTSAELEDYTYRVAGCVGEFWTKLCRAHLFPNADLDDKRLVSEGIQFGQGLQMVNILRDLPADMNNGRCYLPLELLTRAGLTPETLLAPENEASFLRLFREQLGVAEAGLAAGWRYINTLPFGQFRVRLACAWPALLGVKTIARLREADATGLKRGVKVPRREFQVLLVCSTLACPIPYLWRKLY